LGVRKRQPTGGLEEKKSSTSPAYQVFGKAAKSVGALDNNGVWEIESTLGDEVAQPKGLKRGFSLAIGFRKPPKP